MVSSLAKARQPALFLLDSLNISGSEKRAVRIVNELLGRGMPVHLGYLNAPHVLLPELAPKLPRVCFERRGKLSPRVVAALARYAEQHTIARIVCFNLYPVLYAALAQRLQRRSLRYSVSLNLNEPKNLNEKAKMLIYAPLLRRADTVVFGSLDQERRWVARYRLAASRCCHVLNGVDTRRFSPDQLSEQGLELRRSLGIAATDVVVGMVANYRPWKCYPEMLAACARLAAEGLPLRALLIGDGTQGAELASEISRHKLDARVSALGQIQDVRPALAAMDVFVLTSSSETFSNAALEAMAMRTPVVLSRVGGLPEMVHEGVNGFLYEAGNVDDLVDRLRPLLTDGATRRTLGDAARRIAGEAFGFERMVDAYARVAFPDGATPD